MLDSMEGSWSLGTVVVKVLDVIVVVFVAQRMLDMIVVVVVVKELDMIVVVAKVWGMIVTLVALVVMSVVVVVALVVKSVVVPVANVETIFGSNVQVQRHSPAVQMPCFAAVHVKQIKQFPHSVLKIRVETTGSVFHPLDSVNLVEHNLLGESFKRKNNLQIDTEPC